MRKTSASDAATQSACSTTASPAAVYFNAARRRGAAGGAAERRQGRARVRRSPTSPRGSRGYGVARNAPTRAGAPLDEPGRQAPSIRQPLMDFLGFPDDREQAPRHYLARARTTCRPGPGRPAIDCVVENASHHTSTTTPPSARRSTTPRDPDRGRDRPGDASFRQATSGSTDGRGCCRE